MTKIDLDAIKRKFEELQNKKQASGEVFDNKFLKIEGNETVVRILPAKEEGDAFYSETASHAWKDGDKYVVYGCLATNTAEHTPTECPLCVLNKALWKAHNALKLPGKQDKSKFSILAGKVKAKPRYFMNVLERETKQVKIFSTGGKLFEKILGLFQNEDYGNILDTDVGHDFKIVKKFVDGFNNYDDSIPRPKAQPLAENKKEEAEIMDRLHNLFDHITYKDYDTLKLVADQLSASVNLLNEQENSRNSTTNNEIEDYLKKLQKESA